MDKGRYLDSWKDIAAYLGRNVRTCRNWERDLGLPIHRLDDSAKSRVFAYTGEIDAWREMKGRLPENGASEATPPPATVTLLRKTRTWLIVGLAAGWLLAAVTAVVLIWDLRPARKPEVGRFTIDVGPGLWLESWRWNPPLGFDQPSRTAMAISGDGRFVIYSAVKENPGPQDEPRLYLRLTDQLTAKPIPGTEGGVCPFLSPDDRWVGFWTGGLTGKGRLMRVSVEGGVPVSLCEALVPYGASWAPDNTVVFSSDERAGLSRISAEGGTPEILTVPDIRRGEVSHRLPHVLPGGRAVLFTIMKDSYDLQPRVSVADLTTRTWRDLIADAADARYVPTGHLAFLRQGVLMVAPFDLTRYEITGQPVPAIADVLQALNVASSVWNTAAGQFSISDSGWLVYAAGGITPDRRNTLLWMDRAGSSEPAAAFSAPFFAPRLSPDGRRIAYLALGKEAVGWVYDLERRTKNRLTREGKAAWLNWTPDGQRIVFGWFTSGQANLYWQPADGAFPMERLTTSEYDQEPGSWSPDGTTLAFSEWHPEFLGNDILLLDAASRRITPFLNSRANECHPEISPDGRWIAYASNESEAEAYEIRIRPFPGPGGGWTITSEGGREPLWARDEKKIYFRSGDGQQVWEVDYRTDGGFSTGQPRLLFETQGMLIGGMIRSWDLSADGRRFLMVKLEERSSRPVTSMVLVQNWFQEIERMVTVRKER